MTYLKSVVAFVFVVFAQISYASTVNTTNLAFTLSEIQQSKVIITPKSHDGFLAHSGLALSFGANSTGLMGAGWFENYIGQSFEWSVLNNKLVLNTDHKIGSFVWIDAQHLTDYYGQHAADEIIALQQLGAFPSGQIETQVGTINYTIEKLSITAQETIVKVVETVETTFLLPDGYSWSGEAPTRTEAFESEQFYTLNPSSKFMGLNLNDLAGDWAMYLHYQHENGSQFGGEKVFGIYADKINLRQDGSTLLDYSNYNFVWSFNNNKLELIDGTTKFVISPVLQQENTYLAIVEQFENGSIERIFSGQIAKFDNSYSDFTSNMVTQLPQYVQANINASVPDAWEDGAIKFDYIWGYHFKNDGTLRRGISSDYADYYNQIDPKFNMGQEWQYSVNYGLVKLTHETQSRKRERTWQIVTVDSFGKALVVERSTWGTDNNDDGVISADEIGNFIPPRLNILQLADLSLYEEAWGSLQDSDSDGLNDYQEEDLGTDKNAADSDLDGLTDKFEFDEGLNPLAKDTDLDGYTDDFEIEANTDPRLASSKPVPAENGFIATDIDSLILIAPESYPGYLAFSGISLSLNDDKSGFIGSGINSYYNGQPITWSILNDNLVVETQEISTFINAYDLDYFSYAYGAEVASQIESFIGQGAFNSGQIEERQKNSYSFEKLPSENGVLVKVVNTVNNTLVLPSGYQWAGNVPVITYDDVSEQRYYTNSPSLFADYTDLDVSGNWGMFLHYSHKNGPFFGGGEDAGIFADKITLHSAGNATTLNSGYSFDWSLADGQLSFENDTTKFVFTPLIKVEKAYLAYVEHYENDQLVRVYSTQMAMFDNSYVDFTSNMVTKLPQMVQANINANYSYVWDENGVLNFDYLWGYQFRPDGSLLRGIDANYENSENNTGPYFSMGQEWQYTVNYGLVKLFLEDENRQRERTWQIISVDKNGKAIVLESSIYGYDLNSDGVISADEIGNFIPPRLNILQLADLSLYEEAWNGLADSDFDGLNDYLEYDLGTDKYNSDSDGDGIDDGFEYTYGLNLTDSSDVDADPDHDGLSNYDEYYYGLNPVVSDTDGDGFSDGDEVNSGSDPLNPDSFKIKAFTFIPFNDVNQDGINDWVSYSMTSGSVQFALADGVSFTNIKSHNFAHTFINANVYMLSDRTNDGIQEIGVFGFDSTLNRYQLLVHNGNTGQKLGVWNWPATLVGTKFEALDDLTQDGIQEYAITGIHSTNGTRQLVVKNGATKATHITFKWPNNWDNTQIKTMSDITGDDIPEVALYGRHTRLNKGQLFINNGASASKLDVYNWNKLWQNIALLEMDDIDGDGTIDWGQFGQRIDDGRYQLVVKKGHDKRGVIRTFTWPNDLNNVSPMLVSDRTKDGVRDVAISGVSPDTGKYFLRINDGKLTNQRIANISWPANWEDVQIKELGDLNDDGINEFALLGYLKTNRKVQLIVKDGSTYKEHGRYTLAGNWEGLLLESYDADGDSVADVVVSGVNQLSAQREVFLLSGFDLSLIESSELVH